MKLIQKNQMSLIYGGKEVQHTSGSVEVGGLCANYTDTITKKGNTTTIKTHWE